MVKDIRTLGYFEVSVTLNKPLIEAYLKEYLIEQTGEELVSLLTLNNEPLSYATTVDGNIFNTKLNLAIELSQLAKYLTKAELAALIDEYSDGHSIDRAKRLLGYSLDTDFKELYNS